MSTTIRSLFQSIFPSRCDIAETTISPWNAESYARAWAFASRYHCGQSYGGTVEGQQIEYINHIGSVAMEVMAVLQKQSGVNGDLAIQCALLHDTLEDTAATYELVKTEFGPVVADGVSALTKDANIADKATKMTDSLRRIKLQSREIAMVKMADRISNLYHPPWYWDNAKILSYRDEAQLIHDELHAASIELAQRLQSMIMRYPQFLRAA